MASSLSAPAGVVERRNGWFETSFMPGRTFTSPADFNAQLADWLEKANSRVVRTIKARPVDLIDHDRSRMLPLPPIPLQLGWRERVRLGRDYYVRLDASDYSVDPQAIGRIVDVTADLDRVRVRMDGRVVADHARVWARGSIVTDPGHVEMARRLRQQFQQQQLFQQQFSRIQRVPRAADSPSCSPSQRARGTAKNRRSSAISRGSDILLSSEQ